MEFILEILSQYGISLMYMILTTLFSYIGLQIKNIYNKYLKDKIKLDVVKNCVKATEQCCKNLESSEKYNQAVTNITNILNSKKIKVSELEIKMMIEAVCHDFVANLKESEE